MNVRPNQSLGENKFQTTTINYAAEREKAMIESCVKVPENSEGAFILVEYPRKKGLLKERSPFPFLQCDRFDSLESMEPVEPVESWTFNSVRASQFLSSKCRLYQPMSDKRLLLVCRIAVTATTNQSTVFLFPVHCKGPHCCISP